MSLAGVKIDDISIRIEINDNKAAIVRNGSGVTYDGKIAVNETVAICAYTHLILRL